MFLDPTSQFPRLLAAARRTDHFLAAVRSLADGVAADSIRSTDLQAAKLILGRAVENAWQASVCEPYFYAGRYQTQPEDVQKLYNSITINGLHGLLLAHRKLSRSQASNEAVIAMRSLVAEALPLAEAADSLKSNVVKGRMPKGPEKPQNPNKDIKTCPVCYRPIAVQRGTMAHHGYHRPGFGFQTASCAGIKFPPLEISSEGLLWALQEAAKSLEEISAIYETRNSLTSLFERTSSLNQSRHIVAKDDPRWPRMFRTYCADLEATMRQLRHEIDERETRLLNWAATPALDSSTALNGHRTEK